MVRLLWHCNEITRRISQYVWVLFRCSWTSDAVIQLCNFFLQITKKERERDFFVLFPIVFSFRSITNNNLLKILMALFYFTVVYNCSSTEFKCASGNQCIRNYYRCDGVFDCNDHSDEAACRKYKQIHFRIINEVNFKKKGWKHLLQLRWNVGNTWYLCTIM